MWHPDVGDPNLLTALTKWEHFLINFSWRGGPQEVPLFRGMQILFGRHLESHFSQSRVYLRDILNIICFLFFYSLGICFVSPASWHQWGHSSPWWWIQGKPLSFRDSSVPVMSCCCCWVLTTQHLDFLMESNLLPLICSPGVFLPKSWVHNSK